LPEFFVCELDTPKRNFKALEKKGLTNPSKLFDLITSEDEMNWELLWEMDIDFNLGCVKNKNVFQLFLPRTA
jgi:hypothetical protein